jgi:hypothetical protein
VLRPSRQVLRHSPPLTPNYPKASASSTTSTGSRSSRSASSTFTTRRPQAATLRDHVARLEVGARERDDADAPGVVRVDHREPERRAIVGPLIGSR